MRYVALCDGVMAGGASLRMADGVAQLTGAELRQLRQRLARVLADPHGKQPVDLVLDLRRRLSYVKRFALVASFS